MFPLLALLDRSSAALGATRDFYHGLLGESHQFGGNDRRALRTGDHVAPAGQRRSKVDPRTHQPRRP